MGKDIVGQCTRRRDRKVAGCVRREVSSLYVIISRRADFSTLADFSIHNDERLLNDFL